MPDKTSAQLAELLKLNLMQKAVGMVDDWAMVAQASENPKDKKEFVEMALKANGAYSKEDAGAHLPTFHITIGSAGIQAVQTKAPQMVEEVPAEVEALPAPDQAAIEKSLSIFDLDLSPVTA